MHSTLSVRTNLIMLSLYGLILATILVQSPPPVAALLLPFPLIGLAAGYAQLRAIRASSGAFIEASTLREVRGALKASGYGKASMLISVLNPFVVLGLVLARSEAISLSTVILALTLFAFARELLSLPGLIELRRRRQDTVSR